MVATAIIESVGIIGCGWLGKALANQLQKQHVNVIGSCTSPEKHRQLTELGISSEVLTLPADDTILTKSVLFKQQNIVICLPPQLKNDASGYTKKIANIVNQAQQSNVKKLILISSTSAYKTLTGKISEASKPNINDAKVQAILAAESLLSNFTRKSAVLRLAGLVGDKRHPGRFLAGKQGLANGNNRVNLIHQKDAVGIIIALLSQVEATGIFNGVSNTNTYRQSFYQQATKALNLPPPEFSHQLAQQSSNQIIISNRVSQQLGYQWLYPDLLKIF